MKAKARVKIFVIILLCFVLTSGLQALMIKVSFEHLTLKADLIVLGEVEEISCEWNRDRTMIYSLALIRVDETVKGRVNRNHVLIQYPGGEIGDIGLKVSDASSFYRGEKVILFLKQIKDIRKTLHTPSVSSGFVPSFKVVEKFQGKFTILPDQMVRRARITAFEDKGDDLNTLSIVELKGKIQTILKTHKESQAREVPDETK